MDHFQSHHTSQGPFLNVPVRSYPGACLMRPFLNQ
jgi:hypothetical protein